MAASDFPLPLRPFDLLRQLQPVFQAEAQALVAVHDNLINKRIEQLRIKPVEEVRPICQRIHEIAGTICQIVAVGVEKPCLFLFQPAELFAELVIGCYKSIRINAARLLKLG